jgi:hypothetical protein
MSEDRRPGEDDSEGTEPLEEVGPADCEAKPTMTEKRVGEMSNQGVAESEHRSDDEVAEQFPIEMIPMVPHPVDGIPVPADERHGIAKAPPFTYEHVVCVEDDRKFVEVFREEVDLYVKRYGAIDSRLEKDLRHRSRFEDNGTEALRVGSTPDGVLTRFGHRVMTAGPFYRLVRPVRERCIHYKRQVFSNDEVTDEKAYGHKIVFRNCTFRRSVGGAFMSLRDEAVYACDYRWPRDEASIEKHIDEPDRMRLRSRAHLHLLPLFGVTGEPSTLEPSSVSENEITKGVTS